MVADQLLRQRAHLRFTRQKQSRDAQLAGRAADEGRREVLASRSSVLRRPSQLLGGRDLRIQTHLSVSAAELPVFDDALRRSSSFLRRIRHFAGPVGYTVDGFVDKNNDQIPRNVSAAMFQSQLSILRSLFPEGSIYHFPPAKSSECPFCRYPQGNPSRLARRPETVSHTIRTQIQSLISLTRNRQSHYIFCVKPNESEMPNVFEMPFVQHQIHYLSLMPVVKIWRMGYCFHLSHMGFFSRYKMLSSETWPSYYGGSLIEGIAKIIQGLPLPSAEFVLGSGSVFLRSPRTIMELEEFRRERLNYLVIIIQSTYRAHVKRKHFLQLKRSQVVIARTWRSWKVCVRAADALKCVLLFICMPPRTSFAVHVEHGYSQNL